MEFTINCPCGCGEKVTATDAGFSATTVLVNACTSQRADGIVSVTIRKSAAMALSVATCLSSHKAGLVWLGA